MFDGLSSHGRYSKEGTGKLAADGSEEAGEVNRVGKGSLVVGLTVEVDSSELSKVLGFVERAILLEKDRSKSSTECRSK